MTGKSKRASRKPYRYRPLEHDRSIRLLQLLPGKASKRVQCRIIDADVDDCPPYEAISYVWGHVKGKTKVLCHGKSVKIPTNLLHALQRFRQEKEPRILWADSVCINQRDFLERRKQVGIMGTIFENARCVLVWLGRDLHSDAQPAFDLVKAVTPLCTALSYPVTEDEELEFTSKLEQFPSSQWDSFKNAVSNPWFKRVWVIQEINLAQDGLITWGDEEVTWDDLCNAVGDIQWSGTGSSLTHNLLRGRISLITDFDFRDDSKLHDILDDARNFECSDPRDKIYALLAHSSFRDEWSTSTSEGKIPVDYSLPYSEIYFATAKVLIEKAAYGPLSTLSLVGHTRETINDLELTSWVPQWNVEYHARVLWQNKIYSASAGSAPQYVINTRNIEVEGLIFDSVKWQSDVFELSDFDLEMESRSNIFEAIWKKLGPLENSIVAEEETLRKFCLTLNAGNHVRRGSWHRAGLSSEQRIADCIAFFEATGIILASQEQLKDRFTPGNRFRFTETTSPCRYRRFFVTERGYYGIGPEVSLEGDQISIFFGAHVPFVIRHVPCVVRSQDTDCFRLCGECYVHGIMNGEAIEMWKNGELEERKFILT